MLKHLRFHCTQKQGCLSACGPEDAGFLHHVARVHCVHVQPEPLDAAGDTVVVWRVN